MHLHGLPLPVRRATALTQHGQYVPSNLIDGNPRSFYASSDTPRAWPWVQIELNVECEVNEVKINNREDCCGGRLSDVEVRVGNEEVTSHDQKGLSTNELCGKFDGPGRNAEVVVIECTTHVTGKYVTIQIKDRTVTAMNIGEVEVFGTILGNKKVEICNIIINKI